MLKLLDKNLPIIASIFVGGMLISLTIAGFSEQIQKKIGSWPGLMVITISPFILGVLIDTILISYIGYVDRKKEYSLRSNELQAGGGSELKEPLLSTQEKT